MSTLGEHWRRVWETVRQGQTQRWTHFPIDRVQVEGGGELGEPFQPRQHYFVVRVNEMYLAYSRQWFSQYDPMVFVVSEFAYDKKFEIVPYMVGPSMVEQYGQQMPAGMIFSNTRVAGVHPYNGGALKLTVVLYRVKRSDYARGLLKVVESVTNALDFSTALGSYVKLAGAVLDGIETVMGLEDTVPLIGVRDEQDPDAGDQFMPGYFALIDAPEGSIDRRRLWVRENKLFYGAGLDTAQPFREADYVLYSIGQTTMRSEEQTLPFYPLFEQVIQAANSPDEADWKRAKATMLTLIQALELSPDLTPAQIQSLSDRYIAEMKRIHDRAVSLGSLSADLESAAPPLEPAVHNRLRAAVQVMDL